MKAFYYEGVCYKEGIGIYQSDERAFERFLVAADEVPEAMYELGLCYIHGLGTVDEMYACLATKVEENEEMKKRRPIGFTANITTKKVEEENNMVACKE